MFLLALHEKQAAVVFQKPWLFIAVGVCVVGGAAFFGGLSPHLCAAFALPLNEHALLRWPRAKPVCGAACRHPWACTIAFRSFISRNR